MAEMTLTNLRKTLFATVDQVLETGEPVVIRRGGRRLVLQEDIGGEPELSAQEKRRRYLSLPPREGALDLSFEEIERTVEETITWDEEPELDL